VVHASNDGVKQESLSAILAHLKPALVEVAGLNVDSVWKDEATKWAIQQIGTCSISSIFFYIFSQSQSVSIYYSCQFYANIVLLKYNCLLKKSLLYLLDYIISISVL
jgi:hypothetical protein